MIHTENFIDKTIDKVGTASPQKEGAITKTIEEQTAKIPSGFYLSLGVGSIALSLAAKLAGRKRTANFIGLWVPTILLLGLYNKLIKVEGSERAPMDGLH